MASPIFSLSVRYFKQQVSWIQSSVKIADEVPRDDPSTINTIYFSAKLDELFKENQKIDQTLRLAYIHVD